MKNRSTEAAIWECLIHRDRPMSLETAQRILELEFSDADRERMHELAERNRRGKLAASEEEELDNFCRVGTMLSALKSQARQKVQI